MKVLFSFTPSSHIAFNRVRFQGGNSPSRAEQSEEHASSSGAGYIEFNTEQSGQEGQSTFALTNHLLRENNPKTFLSIPAIERENRAAVITHEEAWKILRQLKQSAFQEGQKIASKIYNKPVRADQWLPSFAHRLCEVLNAKGIRRQESLAKPLMDDRALKIRERILDTGDPKLAIIGLPFKSDNPAKADSHIPAIGDASALLRLWKIAVASDSLKHNFENVLFEKLKPNFPEINSKEALKHFVKTTFEKETLSDSSAGKKTMETLKNLILTDTRFTSHKAKKFLSKLYALKQDIGKLTIKNEQNFYRLLIPCVEHNIHPFALLEFAALDNKPVQLNVVRDPRRYPCFRTQGEECVNDYADALSEITEVLKLDDHLAVETLDSKFQKLDPAVRDKHQQQYRTVYEEFLEEFKSEIALKKPELIAANSREEFLDLLKQNEVLRPLSDMFEPILFDIKHPELERTAQSSSNPIKSYLQPLAEIYSKKENMEEEKLRGILLINTLEAAAEYVSAYNSNTGTRNKLGLDDVKLLMGGELTRLSIHKKDPKLGQFTIMPGPSVHRAPWQASGLLGVREDGFKLDDKLSIELKSANFSPVLIANDESSPSKWMKKLAQFRQPLFWVHPHDLENGKLSTRFFKEEGVRQWSDSPDAFGSNF